VLRDEIEGTEREAPSALLWSILKTLSAGERRRKRNSARLPRPRKNGGKVRREVRPGIPGKGCGFCLWGVFFGVGGGRPRTKKSVGVKRGLGTSGSHYRGPGTALDN